MSSYAELSFEQLNEIVSTPGYLQGEFSQQKYLTELDATLNSSGVFSYQRDQSIRWQTVQPIQNVLIMTPQSIISRQGDNEIVNLEAASNPAVAILSDIFFSVLMAEWQTLSSYFSMSGTLEGQQWQVELLPVDKTIMQLISRVELRGDTLLRTLVFYENNGDRTIINFDKLSQ